MSRKKIKTICTAVNHVECLEQRQLLSALLNVRMVVDGGASDGAGSLVVTANQKVNFRIVARLAPIGTTNETKGAKISSLSKSPTDGINLVHLSIGESASDQIKADFTAAVTLSTGFDTATFSSPGTPTLRGNSGLHDLDAVSAVQPLGSFVGVTAPNTSADVVLAKGSFTVKSLGTGAASTIFMTYLSGDTGQAVIRINGGKSVPAVISDSDPVVKYAGLTLANGGSIATGSVAGKVYSDKNANGVMDAGEAGVSGVTLFLDADKDGILDPTEAQAITDAGGNYSFSSLAAGTYRVAVVPPAGFKATAPASGFSDVAVGTTAVTGKNFGVQQSVVSLTGSISGSIFNDANKNGDLDAGDTLLSAHKMYIDANKNGKLDSGEKSATSNASGVYTFTGLAAGTYEIRRADLPAGYSYTEPVSGFYDVTLAAGQNVTGKDIGAVLGTVSTNSASISGAVFNDGNKNGKFDAGDTLLSARKMYIDANKNGKLDSGEKTATTNASGIYTFSGLAAGTYEIRRADTPAGYLFTEPASGFYDVTVAAAQVVTGKDFGAVQGSNTGGGGGNTASISGTVFNDTNDNGKRDTGESLLSARKIYIDANKNGKLDSGEKSVLTNASGVYTFAGLAAGTYEIRRADTPAGYKITDPASGFYDISVVAGQVVTGKDIGAFA